MHKRHLRIATKHVEDIKGGRESQQNANKADNGEHQAIVYLPPQDEKTGTYSRERPPAIMWANMSFVGFWSDLI